MIKEHVICSVFVVNTESINHCGTGFIQANNLDVSSLASKLDDNFVERTHGRDVPKVCATDIDVNLIDHFLIIKRLRETVCAREEHLTKNSVASGSTLIARR